MHPVVQRQSDRVEHVREIVARISEYERGMPDLVPAIHTYSGFLRRWQLGGYLRPCDHLDTPGKTDEWVVEVIEPLPQNGRRVALRIRGHEHHLELLPGAGALAPHSKLRAAVTPAHRQGRADLGAWAGALKAQTALLDMGRLPFEAAPRRRTAC